MSNFNPTVGRTVQYLDDAGIANAAIITKVVGGVNLTVFKEDGTLGTVINAKEYVVGARNSDNVNVYLSNWQGR